MAINVRPGIVTNGLVLNLDAANTKSYPRSGTTWNDMSGNGFNGTLNNGPIYTSEFGGAVTFDGTNDYLLGNNSLASRVSTAVTVIVWARIPNFNSRVPLFSKYQNASPAGYILEVGTLSTLWTRSMRFYIAGNNTNNSSDYRGSVSLVDNIPYMFTATFDRNSQTTKMYYNTTEMPATQAGNNTTDSGWSTGSNPYYVGAYSTDIAVYGNSTIYSTQVYNRAFSLQEIQQNYNAQKARFGLT